MRFSGATARLSLETPPMITTLSPESTSFTWPFSHPAMLSSLRCVACLSLRLIR